MLLRIQNAENAIAQIEGQNKQLEKNGISAVELVGDSVSAAKFSETRYSPPLSERNRFHILRQIIKNNELNLQFFLNF